MFYKRKFADAMTIINALGGQLHLFITFTMDRECQDFKQMLTPLQTPDGVSLITCRLYYDRLDFRLNTTFLHDHYIIGSRNLNVN